LSVRAARDLDFLYQRR